MFRILAVYPDKQVIHLGTTISPSQLSWSQQTSKHIQMFIKEIDTATLG